VLKLPPTKKGGGKKRAFLWQLPHVKRSQNNTMAIIQQKQIFVWSDIEDIGDLERFQLVLEAIPDEELMRKLEEQRGASGINKYPVRAVWNSLIAGVIFEHNSIESLRRELKRNPLLRQLCGFNVFVGTEAVPSAGCYSRFLSKLSGYEKDINKIFQSLLSICFKNLEGFGKTLAIDGKALPSFARSKGKIPGDRRGEHDARWGKHVMRSEDAAGRIHETVKKWFGFTLHMIVDTKYELPLAYTILPASENEMPVAHKLIERMEGENPEILSRCEYFCGDKGYDDGKLHTKLWDKHEIKPVIDIRGSWKDGEETRAYEKAPGVVYNNRGEVFCISPYFEEQKRMACRGYERKRNSLKYRCPAQHYGMECKGKRFCELPEQIRIPLSEDRRIFSPVARDSYKWKRIYASRTAVERVNSRIDTMFGFEHHTIRGLKKMNFRVSFAFILMLSFAVGKIQQKKEVELRQFLRAS